MSSVISPCETCGHRVVCGRKNNLSKHIDAISIDSDTDIFTVKIECRYYASGTHIKRPREAKTESDGGG
jgi:hypothetical protein